MKYLIIGAGGTGGAIGSYMARAGKDVTFIARGQHMKRMLKDGLKVIRPRDEFVIKPVSACSMEEYLSLCQEPDVKAPDVIFVCVKGYSMDSVIPFVRAVADRETIVVPILNIYGTGGMMQEELPEVFVTDGCIYVASEIKEPGVILMKGDILRVIFGRRRGQDASPEVLLKLMAIEQDLKDSGITGILSNKIEKDALLKFSYVSPAGACGLYYNVAAGAMQEEGKERETFAALIHEIDLLAQAMDITFDEDIVKRNLDILSQLAPDSTTSMQRDVAAGKQSEIDGLIYEVVRLGESLGVELPVYKKVAEEMKRRGIK